jgi:hypothetical protein
MTFSVNVGSPFSFNFFFFFFFEIRYQGYLLFLSKIITKFGSKIWDSFKLIENNPGRIKTSTHLKNTTTATSIVYNIKWQLD